MANHSVRKASIGKFLDANIPEMYVAQHIGHNNTDSLKNYKAASVTHRFQMSHILSASNKENIKPATSISKSSSTIITRKQVTCDVIIFIIF